MSSKVSIINAAFLLLGHRAVNNLGDDSGEDVKKAVALYDIYYPSLLTYYPWRFALKQFPLVAPSSFDTIVGYQYAYYIPNDYLSIFEIQPLGNYKIYGSLIYTNLNDPNLKLFYTHKVSEENLPDYYVQFLVEKFAELFAMPITQQPELAQMWGQSAERQLNRATALDSQSQTSDSFKDNPLGRAKYSYTTGF